MEHYSVFVFCIYIIISWHIMMTANKTETRVKANHSSKTDKIQIRGKEGKGGDKPAGYT